MSANLRATHGLSGSAGVHLLRGCVWKVRYWFLGHHLSMYVVQTAETRDQGVTLRVPLLVPLTGVLVVGAIGL